MYNIRKDNKRRIIIVKKPVEKSKWTESREYNPAHNGNGEHACGSYKRKRYMLYTYLRKMEESRIHKAVIERELEVRRRMRNLEKIV